MDIHIRKEAVSRLGEIESTHGIEYSVSDRRRAVKAMLLVHKSCREIERGLAAEAKAHAHGRNAEAFMQELLASSERLESDYTTVCEAIDCTKRIKKGAELCASCSAREEEMHRSYALS